MKIKKLLCAASCIVLLLSGCSEERSSYTAYTYKVDTGDEVRISLDTTGGYSLTSDLPFTVSCDGEVQSEGTFIKAEAYSQYVEAVITDNDAVVIDTGSKDGNEYIFWSYNGEEYNYAILIGDSDTAVVIGNIVSEKSAKESFRRLEIQLKHERNI